MIDKHTTEKLIAAFAERSGTSPERFLRLLGILDAAELEQLGDSLLNMSVMLDVEFQRRFPAEYKAWQDSMEQA